MMCYSIRFSSSVTGSILMHRGHSKKKYQDMAHSFTLNAERRSEFEIQEKVEDVELN